MDGVKVNWLELSNLSKSTLSNCEEFEDARKQYQQIIKSISDCWVGSDCDTFQLVANDFLEYLKGNTNYLNHVGKLFDISSKTYNSVVDEHTERFRRFNQLLEENNVDDPEIEWRG